MASQKNSQNRPPIIIPPPLPLHKHVSISAKKYLLNQKVYGRICIGLDDGLFKFARGWIDTQNNLAKYGMQKPVYLVTNSSLIQKNKLKVTPLHTFIAFSHTSYTIDDLQIELEYFGANVLKLCRETFDAIIITGQSYILMNDYDRIQNQHKKIPRKFGLLLTHHDCINGECPVILKYGRVRKTKNDFIGNKRSHHSCDNSNDSGIIYGY